MAIKLALVACLMFGFGFLLVPLYDIICDVTGLNGKTGVISEERVAQNNLTLDKRQERPVTIEMIAHVDPAMNWHFAPESDELEMTTGHEYTIYYLARNNTDRDMTVQAAPSVVPARAASHLKKIECFCFEKQFLRSGEELRMPARIVVGAGLPDDIRRVTLNYTLFAVKDTS